MHTSYLQQHTNTFLPRFVVNITVVTTGLKKFSQFSPNKNSYEKTLQGEEGENSKRKKKKKGTAFPFVFEN